MKPTRKQEAKRFKDALEELQITASDLALLAGVTTRCIHWYTEGGRGVSKEVWLLLEDLKTFTREQRWRKIVEIRRERMKSK
jgi:hypothetical protein